ncbi:MULTISPECIES: hypothetical protein [unclassified Brevundimonas]|uniref:hypothetical protein n=1 Tax=unclassified Brevundimonas TaxID=2622653 RepID=UPI0025BFBBF1|nr:MULTISPECIES: hypothetical protein [unclassified Brevundimonas]
MNAEQAITAMRQRAANLDIERARLAGAMRAIRDMGGMDAVRAMTKAEIEKLTQSANDNGEWIG